MDRITLLPRDMSCLYAYWELSPQLKDMVKKHFSLAWEDVKLKIIITELGSDSGQETPVAESVPGDAVSGQYFEVPDWQRVRANLGFIMDGNFVLLLASNIVCKYACNQFNKPIVLPPISPLGISSGFRS